MVLSHTDKRYRSLTFSSHRSRYDTVAIAGTSAKKINSKGSIDIVRKATETVKGYLKHERETLEAVISARNAAVSANNQAAQSPGDPRAMQELAAAETALTGTMGRLFALSEAYPDFKGDRSKREFGSSRFFLNQWRSISLSNKN